MGMIGTIMPSAAIVVFATITMIPAEITTAEVDQQNE